MSVFTQSIIFFYIYNIPTFLFTPILHIISFTIFPAFRSCKKFKKERDGYYIVCVCVREREGERERESEEEQEEAKNG